MTLKEAKKILEKEGFKLEERPGKPYAISEEFTEFEDPNICEAMQVVSSAGYAIMMAEAAFNARKARLKGELEEHANAPVSGKEKAKEENPALKESASQFNDALLDEQAKKIEELTKENEDWKSWHEMQNRGIALSNIAFRNEKNRLVKEIARLNKIIHKKSLKIEELRKESSRHLRGKIKMFGENVDLEQMLKDKDAVLSDVTEELRLSKIREKNLVEVSQKYMKEIEELNEKAKSVNMHRHKELAEKDEVIAELTHELEAKHKEYVWYKGAYDGAQQILDTIADYAAKHHDKKFSDQMVGVDKAEEGGDHSAKVVLCGKDVVKKFKENEESVFDFFKRHKETAEELYEVADEAFEQLLLFGEVIIKSEK